MAVENVDEVKVSRGVCVSKGCVYVSKGVSRYHHPLKINLNVSYIFVLCLQWM